MLSGETLKLLKNLYVLCRSPMQWKGSGGQVSGEYIVQKLCGLP